MHIKKVSEGLYEVRRHRYPRPMFRGTMAECVEFMRINNPKQEFYND
jgi:hypothetical protein